MAYTKTVWENGSSAVNATNMNHIEQGIYDNSLITDTVGDITNLTTNNKTNVVSAINEVNTRTIMNIGLTDSTSSLSAGSTIPLDTQINSIGSGLTFDSTNHGIKIGANISYVNVSAMMAVQYSSANNTYSMTVAKNGTQITNIRAWTVKNSTNVFSATIPPILVPVQENDLITLVFVENSATVRPETFLNVEVVK